MAISENIARIQHRMESACKRAGRSPDAVRLMAVSKTHPASAIREAYDAGIRLFGENRVQEFAAKVPGLVGLDAEFHLIGHLQSNKSGRAAELFSGIDSVDSLKLARRLNADAQSPNTKLNVLIEINVGGETAKSGFGPDSAELDELLQAAASLPYLAIRGLMAIPPHTDDPQDARFYFQKLRKLRDDIAARNLSCISMDELSIGMSHDFEVAIEEGSTCIRVGTAIFGERPKP
jgi:pyridoxal phosphate enzyme (YggS family)